MGRTLESISFVFPFLVPSFSSPSSLSFLAYPEDIIILPRIVVQSPCLRHLEQLLRSP